MVNIGSTHLASRQMYKTKWFIAGFCLSFSTIAIMVPKTSIPNTNNSIYTNAKIELYKKRPSTITYLASASTIKKSTIFKNSTPFTQESTDEEILSINIDNTIPIDFNSTISDNKKALITTNISENLSASLPSETANNITQNNTYNQPASNHDILELVNSDKHKLSLPGDNIIDNQASFMVAERIKESVLFPISEEILNDENLTPTFIRKKNKTKESRKLTITPKEAQQTKKTTQTATQTNNDKKNSNTFLDNLSSLFQKKEEDQTDTPKTKKAAPTYSNFSQSAKNTNKTQKTTNQQISSFYEALKETKHNHEVKNIIPRELSLHFNPNKAEISGRTLKWIRVFSEEATRKKSQLQITLSNTKNVSLQEKRLNLLYNILANTDIDFSMIDISIANIDEDTFIIMIENNNQEM